MRKKIAILGASYLQRPLVLKAKEMGLETHVFAWQEGNVVEDIADYFYPISILDKEGILTICKKIKVDGITSIASDIAMPAVNYVAQKLSLIGNSLEATLVATDKFEMRKALKNAGISCPKFSFYQEANFTNSENFKFPVIVKPTDRSGSRGVTKIEHESEVNYAITKALKNSINGRVIVEDFIEYTREFSIEMISYKGKHYYLAITDKTTTGAPYFVEIAHHQPADLTKAQETLILKEVYSSLDALQIENGASHSEVFLTKSGDVKVIEIAMRMGGELIGSHMVKLSTGYDFVKGVLEVAIGEFEPSSFAKTKKEYAGVYYVLPKPGKVISVINHSNEFPNIVEAIPLIPVGDYVPEIVDGADKRAGIIVYHSNKEKIFIEPNEVIEFHTSNE